MTMNPVPSDGKGSVPGLGPNRLGHVLRSQSRLLERRGCCNLLIYDSCFSSPFDSCLFCASTTRTPIVLSFSSSGSCLATHWK